MSISSFCLSFAQLEIAQILLPSTVPPLTVGLIATVYIHPLQNGQIAVGQDELFNLRV
jgi:hypothetical protein